MSKIDKDKILAELFSGKRVRATSWDLERYVEVVDGQVLTSEGEAFNIMDAKEKEWALWTPVEKSEAVIDKKEAIQAAYSGKRVRSTDWIASYVEVVDGQLVDEKGNPYNIMTSKIDKWVIGEFKGEVSSNELGELKKMIQQLMDAKETEPKSNDGRSVEVQNSTNELLSAVYGVTAPAEIEKQFKEAFEGANSSREAQQVVCEFIPYCWIGGRALNTTKQYYTKMRNIIKDSKSEYTDMALAIFLPPSKLYETLKERTDAIKKEIIANKDENFSIDRMKQIIIDLKNLIDGGEDAIKKSKLKSNQTKIERAVCYAYALYILFVTGRRQSEILKTLKIVNRDGTWYYDGVLKDDIEGKTIEAYALDDDFKFLQGLVNYVQEHLGTEKMTNEEVNSKYNSTFNGVLKRFTGGNYTFKYVREVYSELMWLEHGNNGSWKDREAYKAKILGQKYDSRLSTPEHYMGLEGV